MRFSYYKNNPSKADIDANIKAVSLKEKTITNKAYMDKNRPKNAALGNIESDDGYKFIGRGLKQTTGRYNYGIMNKIYYKIWSDKKVNFLEMPEFLEKSKYD